MQITEKWRRESSLQTLDPELILVVQWGAAFVLNSTQPLSPSVSTKEACRRWCRGVQQLCADHAEQALATAAKTTAQDQLKQLVYRKCLQALIYPISATTLHNFCTTNFQTPTWQGFRCSECHGEGDRAQNLISVIRDRMKAQERNKTETFGGIANSFGVDDKTQQEVDLCQRAERQGQNGKSDPYVTAQVGKVRKRTRTIHQELNPVWNKKFTLP
ncbi:Protein unc-13 A [Globodera pallida]|nr:Protein unc-13 A [Globodera pallida]